MQALNRRQLLTLAATLPALGVLAPPLHAQAAAWPATTRIVVPLPAGGGVDVAVRKFGEQLAKALGTSVIVDNKPGASGQIAVQSVATAPADGSTILYLHSGILTAQAITGRMNVLKDFKMVSKLSASPHVLAVPANSPYKTVAELIAAIQAKPGKLNYGSGGTGSPTHLMFERMEELVPGGLNATHVPFKGGPEVVVAMIGGNIDFAFLLPALAAEHFKSGKLHGVATTGAARMPQLANLPTLAESGLKGYEESPWGGLAVPAKTPDDVVARLAAATKTAANSPEFVELITRLGGTIEPSTTPAAFSATVAKEIDADKLLVVRLGIKAE